MKRIFNTNKQLDLYSKASIIGSAFKFYYNPLKSINPVDFKNAKVILNEIENWDLKYGTNAYSVFKNDAILVSFLAYRLGEFMGLDKESLSNLYIAGLVQGIGKIHTCGDDQKKAYQLFTSSLKRGEPGFDPVLEAIKKYPSETLRYLRDHFEFNDEIVSTASSFHSVHSTLFSSGYPNIDTDITQLDTILWFANSLSSVSFASEELLKRNYKEDQYVSIIEALELLREQTSDRVPALWGKLSNATLISFIFALSLGVNPSKAEAANYTPDEVVSLVNEYRLQNGLEPLDVDEKLVQAAKKKAEDMFSKNYWDHNGPSGETPWQFIKNEGYEYDKAGENLAKGFSSAYRMNQAWLNSSSHKKNIVNEKYSEIGVAVMDGNLGGKNVTLVVQLFANEKKGSAEDSYKKLLKSIQEFLDKVKVKIADKK